MTAENGIKIRPPKLEDAAGLSRMLIASITHLCDRDHRHDPEKVAAWTANKTPENIAQWITGDGARILVAERQGMLAGAAGYTMQAHVVLNYVDPRHRFIGVSAALLTRVEQDLRQEGFDKATLESTQTAESFYLARGWVPFGPKTDAFGMLGQRMAKDLSV